MTTLLINAPALGHTFPHHPEHAGRVPAIMFPRLLSTIVALYLIVIGILGLLGIHQLRL